MSTHAHALAELLCLPRPPAPQAPRRGHDAGRAGAVGGGRRPAGQDHHARELGLGLGTTGLNTATGTARNPHDASRHTGGSSSGSAAAVAAGVCAFATGHDGGGSIRIPSALCGCVGLEPTHGRVCALPGPRIAHTVCVAGPIAGCVADAALMFAALANRGHAAHGLAPPPPLALPDLSPAAVRGPRALAGRTAGIPWAWFRHAEPAVVAACEAAVAALQARGLRVEGVAAAELAAGGAAHSLTIASEMRSCMGGWLQDGAARRALNAETRVSLAVAAGFGGYQYVAAQQVRRRQDAHFRRLFRSLDFIITPAAPAPAPPVRPAALAHGESDLAGTTEAMRFVHPANFVGFPAISVPVGAASAGGAQLPVGLQLMAPPWHESALLHAAAVLEDALGAGAAPRPAAHWDILPEAGPA
jgi:Asp-tRNA(Asn)/Glu-tRNA(Gln) amidotransferase A subunit family amidase